MKIMYSRIKPSICQWTGMALLMLSLIPLSAQAEWMLSVYGGLAHTLSSDVTLKEPGGTNLTFHGVSWDDESFKEPQYFGFRLGYWFGRQSPWGLAIDFTHAKMIAELDQEVRVTGRRRDSPVDGDEVLGDTFVKLEFSHGHNLLTLNALYRWLPLRRSSGLDRLQPYVGLGAGIAIPNVEIQARNSSAAGEYQVVGPALQGLAGLHIHLIKHVSVFAEVRLSYAHMDADLPGGSSVETDAFTYHLNFGLSLST